MKPVREQLCGVAAITAALDAGQPLQLILTAEKPKEAGALTLLERARSAGIEIRVTSERSLWRLSKTTPAAELLGLVGPSPKVDFTTVLQNAGLIWQLCGLTYPGNTGFAIRLADVSGADAIAIDSTFDHDGKREALRASMRADRFFPVFWQKTEETMALAKATGRPIWAIEDVGEAAPWEVDLTQPLVLIVGGERHGIPQGIVRQCDAVLRIPMRGFIPSYNVQAAMAIVVGERLRQLGASDQSTAASFHLP